MERTQSAEIVTNIWTLILLISAIVWFAVKQTSFKDKTNGRLENLEEKCNFHWQEIIALRDKVNSMNVDMAEIRKDIKNMFEVLVEIKASIKGFKS